MQISGCGYYNFGTTCRQRNLLKTVQNLGRASPHALCTVMEWTPWGGDGALSVLTDERQDVSSKNGET